jgi:hypothetical protein
MADYNSFFFDETDYVPSTLSADDFAAWLGAFLTDGVRKFGSNLQVLAGGGMSVNILPGYAKVDNRIFHLFSDINGSSCNITIAEAASQPRIDRIVMRKTLDPGINRVILAVLTGSPGLNPQPPALTRSGDTYEMSLARVYVPAGSSSVVAANITDERSNAQLCGQMTSLLDLDASAWQTAFDEFVSNIGNDYLDYKSSLNSDFQSFMLSMTDQFGTTKSSVDAWFSGAQTDIATAAGFDFWNAARMPGNYYITSYPADGSVVTTLRKKFDDTLVAVGATTYPVNGSVVYEEIVYQSDGVTEQRHTIETTTYPGANIRKEVLPVL